MNSRRFALLIGVNGYNDRNFGQLRYCAADVQALAGVLRQVGYDPIVTLHDEETRRDRQPTRDNLEAELKGVCRAVGQDDLLWVHFSGHGCLVEREGQRQPVLLTPEIRKAQMSSKALPLAAVEGAMKGSRARRLFLTIDACQAGVSGRAAAAAEFVEFLRDRAWGFALLAASTSEQAALEWGDRQHGLFTYYVLEGLSGKAARPEEEVVTVAGLADYVQGCVVSWALEQGFDQSPTKQIEGFGDMVLADFRERGRPVWSPGQAAPSPSPEMSRQVARKQDSEGIEAVVWTGRRKKQFRKAIIATYRSSQALRIFLMDELDVSLAQIADETNLETAAYDLIEEAEAKQWLDRLYAAFCRANPQRSIELHKLAE